MYVCMMTHTSCGRIEVDSWILLKQSVAKVLSRQYMCVCVCSDDFN